MGSSTPKVPFSPFLSVSVSNPIKLNTASIKTHTRRIISKIPQILRPNQSNIKSRNQKLEKFQLSCFTIDEPQIAQPSNVWERLQYLDFEFKSLPEPIDRVKRLLHYATLLPPFDESSRIQENRVKGCTAEVWLEVKMDGDGMMRFRVDSDSEITKGFCSCLIWLLDGAAAQEVLAVSRQDLVEMNVGLPSRGTSRVNTWHNVLIKMQKKTRDLVEERDRRMHPPLETRPSLLGSCKEIQDLHMRKKNEVGYELYNLSPTSVIAS